MRWDRLFEDLEHQLDSDREAERAAVADEAERLRVSKLGLRERLIALLDPETPTSVTVELTDASTRQGRLDAVGADVVVLRSAGSARATTILRLDAVVAIGMAREAMRRSVRADAARGRSPLADRLTWGYILRDTARRREAVLLLLNAGRTLHGTIDRVGADHLDIALHERGTSRRSAEVTDHRVVPFSAVAGIELLGGQSPARH